MKLIKKDFRKGFVKLEIQNLDDLWYLSTIIDPNDIVSANTERKIKIGGDDARNIKIVRKKVWLKLFAEKIQFSKDANGLKVLGKIAEGKDDIAAGDYHSFNIGVDEQVEINKGKKGFLTYQIEKIEEACKNTSTAILVCALDRDQFTVAIMKKYGFDIVADLKGQVEKKDYKEKIATDFFSEIVKKLTEIIERMNIKVLVIGSVGFWKDKLAKKIEDTNIKSNTKIIYTSCNDCGINGINEVLVQEETKASMKDERSAIELSKVGELLSEISKDGNVCYGFDEASKCAKLGAVTELLITDTKLMDSREDGSFEKVEEVMRNVDMSKGKIIIISGDHEGGEQLNGLGGIGGLLRYKV